MLGDLTGVAFQTHKPRTLEDSVIWETAKKAVKQGGILAFYLRQIQGQSDNLTRNKDQTSGVLLGGTVCKVISFSDEKLPDGNDIHLLKLRVSQGSPNVQSLWPGSQLIWADNFQNRLGPLHDSVEHSMWLPVDVCKNLFDEMIEGSPSLHEYHEGMKLPNPHQSVFVCKQLSPQPMSTQIILHQLDLRKAAISGATSLKYPYVRLTLLELATFGFKFITSKFAAGREVSITEKLSSGNYILLVEQYFPPEASDPGSTISLVTPEKIGCRLLPAPNTAGLFAATELEAWRNYVNLQQSKWVPQVRDDKENMWSVYLHKDTQSYLQIEAIFNNSDPQRPQNIVYERTYTGRGVQFSENVFNSSAILRPNPQQVDLALIKPNPIFSDNEFVIGGFMPVLIPRLPDTKDNTSQSTDTHFSKTFAQWQKLLTDMSATFDTKMVDGEGACGKSCNLI